MLRTQRFKTVLQFAQGQEGNDRAQDVNQGQGIPHSTFFPHVRATARKWELNHKEPHLEEEMKGQANLGMIQL